jgi:hypothetical protein
MICKRIRKRGKKIVNQTVHLDRNLSHDVSLRISWILSVLQSPLHDSEGKARAIPWQKPKIEIKII